MAKLTKAEKELQYLRKIQTKRTRLNANRALYRDNLRAYMAEQNYVHRVHEYLEEISEINQEIKNGSALPLVDPDTGLVNRDYVDLDQARVRIVVLKQAIDVNMRLLNKILPDAREADQVDMTPDKTSTTHGETFLAALSMAENVVDHDPPPPKLLN